ncbi:MAG: prolyl oligopeptidase family serine peptidase, partial [Bacteroidetes bacterium]|nr:prolyl oligopeptidase family serine peptidase [Bacteroidota bacterium]
MTHLALLILFACATQLYAADKKPLTHDVYDQWKKISGEVISNDGTWVLYVREPQEGDAALVMHNLRTQAGDTVQRGTGPAISFDSRFAAFLIKPPFAEIKKAKKEKKKADEMPRDSLGIVELGSDSVARIPRVKSFTFPEKGAGWIAFHLEKETPGADTAEAKTKTDKASDAEGDEKDKKDESGTTLVVCRFSDGREFRFPGVTEYAFSKPGNVLGFAVAGDSANASGVYLFATSTATIDTISTGKGTYKRIAFDDDGKQLAFLADRDTSKAKQRYFSLCYWTPGLDSAIVLVDTAAAGFTKGWLVSEHATPDFSRNGTRLYFGTAPVPMPEDTTLLEDETAKLDIWNWQDEYLQPHQLKLLDQELKRSYLAVVHMDGRRFVQLGTPEVPTVTTGSEGDADLALGLSNIPYRKLVSWEDAPYHDVYVIDVGLGGRARVLEKVKGTPGLSPGARYVFWYDFRQKHWRTLSTASKAQAVITRNIKVPLYNELSDVPDDPGAYGVASWTRYDSTVLIYDRFDIWSADPTGKAPAVCVTAGRGRTTQTSFRYLRMDPEERFLLPNARLLLRTFDTVTKAAGLARMDLSGAQAPVQLFTDGIEFTTPIKAKQDSTYIFQQSSFTRSPDLYAADASFHSIRRLSDINPQQKDYLWGTVELMHWKTADGRMLDGLLYKPEQFDSTKKYPMIVYYYERTSDILHRYHAPQPSASTINPSYCVSNGYIVFIPDIRYKVGYPGQSALDCILPGVRKLIAAGFVDPARIGLQGQSWGGYQTAFIVTRTGMFRAAMAGAPVSNMTSAYGGIRWQTGMSRMFQYERDQSR